MVQSAEIIYDVTIRVIARHSRDISSDQKTAADRQEIVLPSVHG